MPIALNYSRTRKMTRVDRDELRHLAAGARLPEKLVLGTAAETVARFRETWATEKKHLPLHKKVTDAVDNHMVRVPLYHGS